jgi:hypothetical protein
VVFERQMSPPYSQNAENAETKVHLLREPAFVSGLA